MDENAAQTSNATLTANDAPANPTGSGRNRVQDLFEWKSLNRPTWNFTKEVYTTMAAVAILLSIIVAFFQEWFLILVIWAIYFLFYQLSKAPPVLVDHKITTEGIISMGKAYIWAELGPFWFTTRGEDTVLHVSHRNIFGSLLLIIKGEDEEKIKDILAEYLPYVEIPGKSTSEKMSDWFSAKFPIERMATKNFKASETPPTNPS